MVGNPPKAFFKFLHVWDPALGECETKRNHNFFDLVVLWKWISSAQVGHSQSHDLIHLFVLDILKQVNKDAGNSLIDQLIAENGGVNDHIREEPHDLSDEVLVEFEKGKEGRNALAAGDVLVERGLVWSYWGKDASCLVFDLDEWSIFEEGQKLVDCLWFDVHVEREARTVD